MDDRSWLRKQASKQASNPVQSTKHKAQREGCFCREHARGILGSKRASAVGVDPGLFTGVLCPECPEYPATVPWNRHPPPAAAGARANQHEQRQAKTRRTFKRPARCPYNTQIGYSSSLQSEIATSQAHPQTDIPATMIWFALRLLQGRGRVVSYQRHTPAVPLDNTPCYRAQATTCPCSEATARRKTSFSPRLLRGVCGALGCFAAPSRPSQTKPRRPADAERWEGRIL